MAENKEIDLAAFNTVDTTPLPAQQPEPAPVLPAAPEAKVTDVELPVTDQDKERYFDCVMNNKPFHEELTAFQGKLKVTMRTRTLNECEEVLKYLNKVVASKEIDFYPDFQNKHLMGHLAYAVSSINGRGVDEGDLDVRLKRVKALDNQVFLIMIEFLRRFDVKTQKLREEALKPNF